MAPQEFRHSTRVGKWKVVGGSEIIASTNSGNIHAPFLDRPPQERRSEVAIVKCPVYGLAEGSVREAIALLGGIDRFCKKGDTVIIKVNDDRIAKIIFKLLLNNEVKRP